MKVLIHSLKYKLIVSIILIIAVFGVVAIFSVFQYSQNILLGNGKSNLQALIIEEANGTAQVFKCAGNLAKTIAQQDFVIDYLENKNNLLQDENVLGRFNSYNIDDAYSAIYLMDRNGKTLVSTNELFVDKNYSFRDYFNEALKNDSFVDVSIGVTSRQLGYYFSQTVKDKEGLILGVVVLKMKPEVIHDSVFLEGEDKELKIVSLIDDYGVIVFSNKEDRIFNSVVDLGVSDLNLIDEKKRFSGVDIQPLEFGISRDNILGIGESGIFDVINIDRNIMLVVSRIDNLPFFIVIEENQESFVDALLGVSYKLGLLVLLFVVLAIASVYLAVNHFSRPLSNIVDVVKKVSEGDLGQRIVVTTKDELGNLGGNLNKLISKLQEELKDVESKVGERTQQLGDVNKIMVGRELKMVELKKEIMELKNKLKKYEGVS